MYLEEIGYASVKGVLHEKKTFCTLYRSADDHQLTALGFDAVSD